jgi:hypothetical protein
LKGLQASPARPSGKSIKIRMHEKENVKIVTVTVDMKSLLSLTAYSYCCVGLFVCLFVPSYNAVPCKEVGMPTGREAFCVYHGWE